MRPSFLLDKNNKPVSCLIEPDTPHAIRKGARVVLAADYVMPWGVLPAGARGVVDMVDQAFGTVWIQMAVYEPSLSVWDNLLVIDPFTCEDLTACISLPVDNRHTAKHIPSWNRGGIRPCLVTSLSHT